MIRKQTRFRCVAQRGWYFLTREGQMGPFDTRREAEVMCQHYIHKIRNSHQEGKARRETRKLAYFSK
ncbi:hypothetical protein Nwat_0697 [Nitrosococcus watsonii C-113]|uniref:DUF6316 domain-containing protein n=1 Tax=Nitrosococcus watsoni (strain C-113) TaxID=105559 RepID=D8KBP2_NITWC|nr:DUF6316 family protein [Nitrosococcus watsonii]ADJ27653.1 hypothetical protein Nwat_0697 [Nitrosococcus watsonii C-113]